jgi:hypothetical protein
MHERHMKKSSRFMPKQRLLGSICNGSLTRPPTGATGLNVRDVPHGAYKVVGDKTIKLLTVHIVDKGKPLYDTPK